MVQQNVNIKGILERLEQTRARTIADLAQELGVNRHYLTGVLLVLEEQGLVQLIRGKNNKIAGVLLTDKGKTILERLKAEAIETKN